VLLIGAVRFRQGRYTECEQLCRRVIRAEPRFWQAHSYLGRSLLRQGKRSEAKPVLQVVAGVPEAVAARAALQRLDAPAQ